MSLPFWAASTSPAEFPRLSERTRRTLYATPPDAAPCAPTLYERLLCWLLPALILLVVAFPVTMYGFGYWETSVRQIARLLHRQWSLISSGQLPK
jgi:hypothetical protein